MSSTTHAAPEPSDGDDEALAAPAADASLEDRREQEFHDIVVMAARACDVPIACIDLVDRGRRWFTDGAEAGVGGFPPELAICAGSLARAEILVIPDVAADPRFVGARAEPGGGEVGFLAGVALRTSKGIQMGTLSVADRRPRDIGEPQTFMLRALARTVVAQIELRETILERDRESRERFDAALASGLLGFLAWDAKSGLVRGDGRFASFCDVDPDAAAAGLPPERLEARVHADDREGIRAVIRQALAAGSDFETEFRIPSERDAGFRWLLLSGHGYAATALRPLRFTGVLVDVTASRMAEAALRASEELNRRVLASSSDSIMVLALDGAVQFINEGGVRALEIDDAATIVGRPWASTWSGAERETAARAVSTASRGGTGRFRGETETVRGRSRWWDVMVTPILDDSGSPERLLCVSRDVTVETTAQRTREALVTERDVERVRLRAVLDSAPVGIVFAEASGRIVGQNPEADRIFRHGLLATDSVAQHGEWVLYTPDGQRLPTERYPLVRALTSGETSAGEEYLYRRGDDTLGWIELTAAPVRDAAGRITGGVVSVGDIGARKNAEAALRRLNETLEVTVAERTRELDRVWRHARDLLCVARFDGTFLRLNPA